MSARRRGDRQLVHAPLGTPKADACLDDMALGANFATVNHPLINAVVLEAFREVFPDIDGRLVCFISHNIAREEMTKGERCWVHRKGSTRAFPAGHPELAGTPFALTGHPMLLQVNPRAGSSVLVALPGAVRSCYSVIARGRTGDGPESGGAVARSSCDRCVVPRSGHSEELPRVPDR